MLCGTVHAAVHALRQQPQLAQCIGRNGRQRLEQLLTRDFVAHYMAAVLRQVAALQHGEDHARYVRAASSHFARVNVTACLSLELRPLVQHECVERVVRDAISWPL